MEKVIVNAKTMKPVKLGDFIEVQSQKKCTFGTILRYEKFMITQENVDSLVDKGILKIVDSTKADIPTDISFYVKKLAKRLHMPVEDVCNMLDNLNEENPGLTLNLLLSQIAKVCNNNANISLEKAKEVYYISIHSGDVYSAPIMGNVHYTNYFLKYEDAVLAKKILAEQFAMMYGK